MKDVSDGITDTNKCKSEALEGLSLVEFTYISYKIFLKNENHTKNYLLLILMFSNYHTNNSLQNIRKNKHF